MSDNRMNFCTLSLRVSPETYGVDEIQSEFQCVKDGFHVSGCRFYKPMMCGDLVCPNECDHFHGECVNKRARKAALKRAEKLLGLAMAEKRHKKK